jgi:hypothetical protein
MKRKKIDWDDMSHLDQELSMKNDKKESVKEEITEDFDDTSSENEEEDSAGDEDDIELTETFSQPQTESTRKKQSIDSYWDIPHIQFSNNPQETISLLNSIIQFATLLVSDESFHKGSMGKEKLLMYSMKVKEGVRLARSLKLNSFYVTEINFIEAEMNNIEEKAKKKKSFW